MRESRTVRTPRPGGIGGVDSTAQDAPARTVLGVTTSTPAAAPSLCTIVGTNGHTISTDSYDAHAPGSRFVSTYDTDGGLIAHVEAHQWGAPNDAQSVMLDLWRTVCRTTPVDAGDGYGPEYVWNLPAGQVRVCAQGTHVRLLDGDVSPLDGGSAYWTSDEWVEDPQLVMGAILGGAAHLQD